MARSEAKPIDTRQHVWWHRLRRLGATGFVAGLGGVVAPLGTVLLFGGVVFAYDYPLSTFTSVGAKMWLLTAPIYMAACLWTWVYMQKRYAATLALHCPGCGYSLEGAASERCPECGEAVPAERAREDSNLRPSV